MFDRLLPSRLFDLLTGNSRSGRYRLINDGLLTRPIKRGHSSSVWPESEGIAINKAVVAGWTKDEVRGLVRQLEAARRDDSVAAAINAVATNGVEGLLALVKQLEAKRQDETAESAA